MVEEIQRRVQGVATKQRISVTMLPKGSALLSRLSKARMIVHVQLEVVEIQLRLFVRGQHGCYKAILQGKNSTRQWSVRS
ncbi:hypothetical protein GCM10023184_28560 [Flaviaesturariibacter amylovorans]|uniref:Uncharacterized protein n=1 Tax=Flaviaesturariibacter amylovorans TaxID=1084520 RepID=A0ABP8H520_9BACT